LDPLLSSFDAIVVSSHDLKFYVAKDPWMRALPKREIKNKKFKNK
jgi:hypothetical protein